MKRGISVCMVALLIAGVLICGCSNVPLGKTQVADFGTAQDAQQAQVWFINAYGNPANYSGGPRILEPMVSDGMVNNMPTDRISTVSQDTNTVYFWAIYEGYTSGDTLTAVWMYNGQQYGTLSKKVGGNYGIVSGQFDKPQSGWVLGSHTIVISGNGAQNSTTFEIISGPSQTMSLPYSGTSSGDPGSGSGTTPPCSGPSCTGVSGTCKDGFVYREAGPSDNVCVPPAVHTQAQADNAAAGSRLATGTYGADTCAQGYVWREAFTSDHVCVLPAVHTQAQSDNSAAASRWVSGAYGPHTCISGFVWREAGSGDDVCVLPAVRTQAAADNAAAGSRLATGTYGADTCAQGYVWREASTTDHVCVLPAVRTQTAADNAAAGSRLATGTYGADTCAQGYVWREAFTGDHVCVTPAIHASTQDENNLASSRTWP